ncbi:MAG: hypothetical protein QOF25_2266 [Mycobacterium sp.]|nr:hypothetical protein [Mycobacterium sp.]
MAGEWRIRHPRETKSDHPVAGAWRELIGMGVS